MAGRLTFVLADNLANILRQNRKKLVRCMLETQIMNHHGEEEFTTSGTIGSNHDFLRFVSTTAFTGLSGQEAAGDSRVT